MKSKYWKIMAGIILMVILGFNTQASAGELSRTIMKVSKLTCGSCLTYIDSKLKGFPEVDGMGASLREGIVAVDHKPSLKPEKIASIITQLGYPAVVIKKITIDKQNAFSSRKQQANTGSCCSTGSSTISSSASNNTSGTEYAPGSCSGTGAGGCGIGPGSGRSCGAGSSAWKQLFQKKSEKKKTEEKTPVPAE